MDGYQRELRDFLTEYGATDVAVTQDGKHPKLEFEFRGKHVAYTIASTPSDHRAAANAIGDLRRMLGDPIEEEKTPSRRLEDMLPAAKEQVVYKGKIASYGKGLRFTFPPGLISAFGIELGDKFAASRLDKDTWHLHKIKNADILGPTVRKEGVQFFYQPSTKATEGLRKGLGPFAATLADYTVVGDAIVVYLPPQTLRPPSPSGRGHERISLPAPGIQPLSTSAPAADAPVPATVATPTTVATPAQIALTETVEDVPGRLRYILALVQAGERQTGYRLIKLRRENEADGIWVWRAPDIRLEEP